jgi:predicted NUDIX family phosphoesterase
MEFVFVVPRSALFPEAYPHGLIRFAAPAAIGGDRSRARPLAGSERFDRAHFDATVASEGFFIERSHAERTPALKQIIPYSIVLQGERILLTKRMKSGGESRLHEKYSIGIGGHINPEDADVAPGDARDPIDRGTRREIEEELAVRGPYNIRRVGLINDDSNAVGAVHVGVVQIVRCEGPVEIREREQLEGRLVTADDLQRLLATGADIETWSQLLIPHLDELCPAHLAVNS